MMGLNVMTNQMGIVFGAALGGLVIAIGGYSELGLLSCATGLLAALSCRILVRPEHVAAVGMEPNAVGDEELRLGVTGN